MWWFRVKVVALIGAALLTIGARPGETVSLMAAPPGGPRQPPGRETPAIDVLAEVSYGTDLFGDVAVERRGSGVAAVRLADGTDAWVYERIWADDFVDWVRVDGRHLAAVWRDGRVTLIDVPTGRMVWHADLPPGPAEKLSRSYDEEWPAMWEVSVAATGSLVVQHDRRVDVLDVRTGAIRWTRPFTSCRPVDGVQGMGGIVLLTHGCEGDTVNGVALDADDGTQLWTDADTMTFITRDLGHGRLVTIGDGGELVVRRAVDGTVLWRARPKGLPSNDATLLGVSDDLLTVDTPQEVVAYRTADGGVAWRRSFGGAPREPGRVLTNGRITYVRETDRTLVKLDGRTGEVIDRRRFAEEIEPLAMRDDLAMVDVGVKHHLVVA
ncbi:outer membrane protein assembly factor BamB family protein [Nonomuraea rhodomycinica]|uniref:PQQ-binding-like beta-propeller repeat protein n=1 Tax=Nonomuraea rhodomycinica TaxID=1712872 RepID=A0A7Y6MFZ4_9ACTN|nr:PQQ-binding-like beta-propeller repeat protein [Nonomuraea rhodomycinica]NUW45364.1 PQQ-binding-like beta-propeller repeat protein [Nonomuraea rhodomycinica]